MAGMSSNLVLFVLELPPLIRHLHRCLRVRLNIYQRQGLHMNTFAVGNHDIYTSTFAHALELSAARGWA